MRAIPTIRACATTIAFVLASTPVSASDLADCQRARDPGARMSACDRVVASQASDADKAIAYRNRGRLRASAGALDLALPDLDAAIVLDAKDAQAYLLRGQVRVARSDPEGAIADFSTAIRLSPQLSAAYAGRGHAQLLKGRARLAIQDFDQTIVLDPRSARAYNNRGLAHRKAGEDERAIADYTAAIMLNPIYALAYNNRAYVHESRGETDKAVHDYRRALVLDPALAGAMKGLERLGKTGSLAAEADRNVKAGKALAEAHCAWCHAVGTSGQSANPRAPAFRQLHARHPIMSLREPLTRGIAAPHDDMPKFAFDDNQIDMIVAYINSLSNGR